MGVAGRVVRGRSIPAVFYCILICTLLFVFCPAPGVLQPVSAAPFTTAQAIPLRPYAYAVISASNRYDVMVGDGVNKDWRVARVKVDSVYFADVAAKLSSDATYVAFRMTGDREVAQACIALVWRRATMYRLTSPATGPQAWGPMLVPRRQYTSLCAVGQCGRSCPGGPSLRHDHVYSAGFEAVKLRSSLGNDRLLGFSGDGLGVYVDVAGQARRAR